ncbi:uncharacterized protein BT62DRAFT_703275 [Guyanagaster necrorhizus]|uniref:RRM domain-containing protein n=1 Tax=Guyanagaster necrorhizus TaxID=856835 RepID=A0A9P8AUE2_9AGAR|nr:uncharacterized protein BT62DRAFT_703275 [Guyanagaster necrorhizus MCA 3950]KAG7448383.1 hypothetical protein BT62DRAFT_703275 [Guyanagaster necrorhizus MCA 3950]
MSGSPHSSLSTPIPPPRAPPSPPESVVSSSTGFLNPNAGDFVPSSLPNSRYKIHSNSPSSVSVHSSPGSSSTSTSVSLTLAPSISTFASFSSNPSLSEITPSTTQSSRSSYHSPLGSPSQFWRAYKHRDGLEEAETGSSASEDAGTLLRSLRIGSPSATASISDHELGEITDVTTSPHRGDRASPSALPSSPEVLPGAPSKKAIYIPLPDIEIHQAAPSSYMNSTTVTGSGSVPVPLDQNVNRDDLYQDSNKTPNVYINGLPPNYPEDQLFELAAPFGPVRSVRSFTRHVGEKESGYGFVLFETIDAAEKCIESLRRFRNLHPTFSKQVHKIPGTAYARAPSISSGHSASSVHGDDDSFKSKMERLHDPNSTNLYMEGLPLSIDESSLGALVSPHRIKSSRFFQTRLSNPPRIIAFVRLDTRLGAEEVIERLHGRMVRGWNDPGSRISVRFADTSEQRELRDDDQSSSRLTIAQAALLNLHGREQLRSQVPFTIGGSRGNPSPIGIDYDQSTFVNPPFRDFSSNAAIPSGFGYRGNDIPIISNTSLASSRFPMSGRLQQSPYGQLSSAAQSQELAALINTLRNNGSYSGADDQFTDGLAHHRSLPQMAGLRSALGNVDINLGYGNHPVIGGGVAQARNGFTATEEYILQAHAAGNNLANQCRRPTGLDLSQIQAQCQGEPTDYNVGVRGVRTSASTISRPQLQTQRQDAYHSPRVMNGALPALQEEFQSSSAMRQGQNFLRGQTRNGNTHQSNLNGSRLPGDRDADQIHSHVSSYSQNSSHVPSQSSNRNQHINQQAHVRSSTLPHSTSTPSAEQHHSRHYQHSSMSIPKSRNISSEILRATSQRVQQHRYANSISGENNVHPNSNHLFSNDSYTSDLKNNNGNSAMLRHHRSNIQAGDDFKNDYDAHVYPHGVFPDPDRDVYDVEQSSPPLVSPALTYSSRGSGTTLSPTTPFVGSFSQQQGLSTEGA